MSDKKSFLEQYRAKAEETKKLREENPDKYVESHLMRQSAVMGPRSEAQKARKAAVALEKSQHETHKQYGVENRNANITNTRLHVMTSVFRDESRSIRKAIEKLTKTMQDSEKARNNANGGLLGDLLDLGGRGKRGRGRVFRRAPTGRIGGLGGGLRTPSAPTSVLDRAKSIGRVVKGGLTSAAEAGSSLLGRAAPYVESASKVLGKVAVPLAIAGSTIHAVSEGSKEDSTDRYAKRFGTTTDGLGDGTIGSATKFAALRAGGAASDIAQALDPSQMWNKDGDSWTDRLFADRRADAGKDTDILPKSITNGLGRSMAVAMAPFSEDARNNLKADWNNQILPGMEKAVEPMTKAAHSMTESFSNFVDNFKLSTTELTDGVKKAAGTAWSAVKAAGRGVIDGAKTDGMRGAINGLRKSGSTLAQGARESYETLTGAAASAKGISAGRWTKEEAAAIKANQDAGGKFNAGKQLDDATKAKIAAEAVKQGIPPEHLLAMAQMESGGNKNAVSSTGAAGLFQFTGGTAKQYGVTNRFDDDQNIAAAARLYKDNKAALEKRGIEANLDNLYLAHQEGVGGVAEIDAARRGQGKLSDRVKQNMSVNVGAGGAGLSDAEYAAKFAEANMKKLADARVRAGAAPTVAGEAPSSMMAKRELDKKNADAQAALAARPKTKEALLAQATADNWQKSQSQPQEKATQVSVSSSPVKNKPSEVQQASVKTNAIAMVPKAMPQEISNVNVVNQPETKEAQAAPHALPSMQVASAQPSLDQIPMRITDMGLVLIDIGAL